MWPNSSSIVTKVWTITFLDRWNLTKFSLCLLLSLVLKMFACSPIASLSSTPTPHALVTNYTVHRTLQVIIPRSCLSCNSIACASQVMPPHCWELRHVNVLASVGQIPWFLSYRCFDSLHQHPILTPTYTRLTIPTYFSPSTSQLLVHSQLVGTNSQLASVGQIPWFLSYRSFDIFLFVSVCWLGLSPWMQWAKWSIDRHSDSNATY